MKTITKENLLKRNHFFNVGELKKYIEENNIPDSAIIVTEIVDDKYFNGGVDISGMRSVNSILPEGSRSNEWEVYIKERDGFPVRYHPIWSPILYKEDKEILFLDLHY